MLHKKIALVLVLSANLMIVTAYNDLIVSIHNFTNPSSGTCPVCHYHSFLPFGCCNEVKECIEEDRCSYTFQFCSGPLKSSPNTDPNEELRCQPSTSVPTFLTSWDGQRVNIQVYTNDTEPLRNINRVDFFSIDIEQILIGVETEPQTFNGTLGFGWISLNIRPLFPLSYTEPNYAATKRRNLIVAISMVSIVLVVVFWIFVIALVIRKQRLKKVTYYPNVASKLYTERNVPVDNTAMCSVPPLFDASTTFIDHEIKQFDSGGGICMLQNCTLTIPKGSIPQDKVIDIEIGVTICTKLTSLLPRDMTPVSPIIQLCVVNEPNFKFTKPVTIQILHCLDISSDEDVKEMSLHFLKSRHNLPCFHTTDGEEEFPANTHHGILTIDHFCSFCIAAGKDTFNNLSKVYYSVLSISPRHITEPKWEMIYCIALYTCCRIVENQYGPTEFSVKQVKLLKFSSAVERDPYIELDFTRHLEGGWYLALLMGPKIRASEIDYVQIEPEVLQKMEKDKLYPPRFTINIDGTNALTPVTLVLRFGGSLDEFTSEVTLKRCQDLSKEQEMMVPLTGMIPVAQSLPNLADLKTTLTHTDLELQSPHKPRDIEETLKAPPAHRELMNHIAVNIPTKWRNIGVQLGLRIADLDAIEGHHYSDYSRCFSDMFNLWEQQQTSPYCWSTILDALDSPLLGECRLAQETRSMLQAVAQEEAAPK